MVKAQQSNKQDKAVSSSDPDLLFSGLTTTIGNYIDNTQQLDLIAKAYRFAALKHQTQRRRSGEPYITHPLAVAEILTTLKVDAPSLMAAILHDVVEDTETPIEEINQEFGEDVADLVDGLTKIRKFKFRSTQEKMAENFRKMVLAMAKDLRVIIIKLADRLHNMRTLGSLATEKRLRISQETLDIYAPLAHRLGIYGIKSELEDLCLKEMRKDIYQKITSKIAAKKKERETYISEVKSILESELIKYGFKNAIVYGRPKHFYSIYKKMIDRKIPFEDIHDLFAFRIIVDTVKDCYEALGVVHSMWKPMPGRFKDYIAMPKANLYQSLHTTVIRPNGSPAEIQIRTTDMHKVCEFGVAAHWTYKEGSTPKQNEHKRFEWLRQMMELQHDVKDPDEFLDAVKVDLFEEEIFVFTPKGDVIQLGINATPLDMAFAIHTDVGLKTVGAKVNGRITPLRSHLNSGDIVEILTSTSQKPSKDWLNFVTSSKARNKIRSYFRSEQRARSRKMGREMLESELAARGLDLDKLPKAKTQALIKSSKESGLDDLFISVGYGRISLADLLPKVFPEPDAKKTTAKQDKPTTKTTAPSARPPKSGVLVSGLDNILVTFGKCCNPIPGDEIIGFITRGRGVSIHRCDCNRALDLDPARRIEVSWADDEKKAQTHSVSLKIITRDRQGVLADITLAISAAKADIIKAQINMSPDMTGMLYFDVNLRDLSHLKEVMNKIESIEDVVSVERCAVNSAAKMQTRKDK